MPNTNMTTTVAYICDQCRLHTKLQNYFNIGGSTNEPGLSICTRVNQKLLTRRMPWKFNVGLLVGPPQDWAGNFIVTQQGMQDIKFAGATLFSLLNSTAGAASIPAGGVSIDLDQNIRVQNGVVRQTYGPVSLINNQAGGIVVTGSTVTVQTIDSHPFQAGNIGQTTLYITGAVNPIFNSIFTFNQLIQTSQWTNGYQLTGIPDNFHLQLTALAGQTDGLISGAPGIFHFGWLQSAYLTDINSVSFPQPTKVVQAVHRIAPDYTVTGEPIPSICALVDYNNGVIKFRLSEPLSTYALQFNLVYQQRAPKFGTPQDVIQWPDDYVFAFQELALWEAMRFAYGISSEEAKDQGAMALMALQSVMEAEDREANTQSLTPDVTLMGGGY